MLRQSNIYTDQKMLEVDAIRVGRAEAKSCVVLEIPIHGDAIRVGRAEAKIRRKLEIVVLRAMQSA